MTAEANAASVALLRDGKVLLIRRAYAPYQHLWTLPGGRMETGETAAECAAREVKEELGLTVSALRHVETQLLGGTEWRLAVFATGNFSGNIAPSDEISAYCWRELAAVAQMEATPGLAQVVQRAVGLLGE
ncbi:MAG TPA: NUDIX domain-containing protein [Devosiaceae bacterium]|jgi:ADP-ribose pyrophosphatase YjhB (NUDIX family)|nr:NUDIX domain-containing protein [Devosiaceae bacterium]